MKSRWRAVIDLIATIAMGTAAVVLLWRTTGRSEPSAGAPRSEAVEDVRSDALVTSFPTSSRRGDPNAPIVMIEFADFQCPFCARYFRDTFPQIEEAFLKAGRVQYVFRNLPLPSHEQALAAAQAAECAGAQGKFWEMHERLFGNQSGLGRTPWLHDPNTLGVDGASFERCVSGDTLPKIREDIAEAKRLKAMLTPTFFVGRLQPNHDVRILTVIRGAHPYAVFRETLERVLREISPG